MAEYTDRQLDSIFAKGRPIKGLNKKLWCLDASDAIICRTSYGRDDEYFGWEVDHIVPKSKLEDANVPEDLINRDENLRPLNWNNNLSKDNEYPKYKTTIVSEDGGKSNIKKDGSRTINSAKQKQLRGLYKDYIKL